MSTGYWQKFRFSMKYRFLTNIWEVLPEEKKNSGTQVPEDIQYFRQSRTRFSARCRHRQTLDLWMPRSAAIWGMFLSWK